MGFMRIELFSIKIQYDTTVEEYTVCTIDLTSYDKQKQNTDTSEKQVTYSLVDRWLL